MLLLIPITHQKKSSKGAGIKGIILLVFLSQIATSESTAAKQRLKNLRNISFKSIKIKCRKIHLASNTYRTVRRTCEVNGNGTVPVVFSQKQGRKGILALFTTDSSLSTRGILAIYNRRWSIVPTIVGIKYAKQYMGLVAYQHRNEEAVRSHLQLSLIAYALLTHLFINEQREKGKKLTKKLISQFSFRESLWRLRAMVSMDTIDCIEQITHSRNNQTPESIFKELKSNIIAA